MPWKVNSPMSERVRFIARVEEGERVTELAREFGISTKTAYKFLSRWKAEGVQGLENRSHAVERIPHRTPDEVLELILGLRREHPTWGARMLKARLEAAHPGVHFPSTFTFNYWLKKKGLLKPRRFRRPMTANASVLPTSAVDPNDVWATDFKGQFRLGNGAYCYPLTASDLASRFILSCEALEGTDGAPVWGVFERLFREHGLPKSIRSDNGSPFASRGLAGLTQLSAKWLRLGIQLQRIVPGHPEQNGQHERMHRTLKQDTTRPAGENLLQQQERFDDFVEDFNQKRPHQALAMQPPATKYRNSNREYRGLPELNYPLADDTRLVAKNGTVTMPGGGKCYLTLALIGETVGIREVDDALWMVTFANVDLGVYQESDTSFTDMESKVSNNSPISPD